MTRLSLLTFFALAFSGVALAAPPASQEIVAAGGLFTGGSWSYTDCGTWYFAVGVQPKELKASSQEVQVTSSPSSPLKYLRTHPSPVKR